jgi:hypothetical protein
MGSKQVVHWTSETWCECSKISGSPQGSPPGCEAGRRTCSEHETRTEDQVGLSHCRHDSLVMVRDKACLRIGHNDQPRQGHQCSKTTLKGETRFHISIPLGIEPGSFMTWSKQVVYWTSETWSGAAAGSEAVPEGGETGSSTEQSKLSKKGWEADGAA